MKPPAFQFYPDDFLGGVADMTQAEVGAYILLLCLQWTRGEIPQDPARCANIAKGEVSPFVYGKFPNGKNARLERVRAEQNEFRENRSTAGKAGAQKRWHSHGTAIAQPLPEHGTAIVLPMANGMANDSSPSPSPSPSSENIKPLLSAKADESLLESIFQAYPSTRRGGRKEAFKAIRTALKTCEHDTLLNAVSHYASSEDVTEKIRKGESHFIPLLATWLNKGRHEVAQGAQSFDEFAHHPDYVPHVPKPGAVMVKIDPKMLF